MVQTIVHAINYKIHLDFQNVDHIVKKYDLRLNKTQCIHI